ncbi:MAG TPA: SEC-C domain-containing protein [Metabacillus sp.]|nr:SEC-C domain-containing protein [Metabacillus sp.]
MDISRNDPCPCGSGKKYKKCCMNDTVVSLHSIRDRELTELQGELLTYALTQHEELLANSYDDFIQEIDLDEDEEELVLFLLTTWSLFSILDDTDQTIVEQFINKKKKENKLRASTLEQLEKWIGTTASFTIVTKVMEGLHIEVEDIFTEEKKIVKLQEANPNIQEGVGLVGFLLPYGSYDSYYTMYLDFPEDEAEILKNEFQFMYDASDVEDSSIFMRANFPSIMVSMLIEEQGLDVGQLDWDNPIYPAVAQVYKQHIEHFDLPEQIQDLGVTLWYIFCKKEQPTIRKFRNYAAALHYYIDHKLPFLKLLTQAEVADMYEVSKGSLAKAYKHLEKGLEDELDKLYDFMEQMEVEDEDGNFFDDFEVEEDEEFDFDDLFPFDEKPKKQK